MSSRRIFELINQIHLSTASHYTKPFGGTQMVIVGEFLQLRPVPNLLDMGEFMFRSKLFERAITHRFELTTIMRQDAESQVNFINCLKEIRIGQCSDASLAFIKALASPIQVPEEDTTHIFFRKLPAQVFNTRKLQKIPGHEIVFRATDVGDTLNFNFQVEKVVSVKPGCKVMLLWNKNKKLRNGTTGTFVRADGDDHIIVRFENVGEVSLKREEWFKRNRYGETVGSRTQFPIMLCYATTCHKAQGLTLKGAVVHCTKEFVPGLIYVAFTRVRCAEHLQVVNFRKQQLLPPDAQCINVCDNSTPCRDELGCCKNSTLELNEKDVCEKEDDNVPEDTDEHPRLTKNEIKNMVDDFFERGTADELYIDLETVHAALTDDSCHDFVRTPPNAFSARVLLSKLLILEPLSDFARRKNTLIEEMLDSNEQIDILGNVLWCRACHIVMEETLLNTEAEVKISTKDWTLNTKELHRYLTKSKDFTADFCCFFKVDKLSVIQTALSSQLMQDVYKEVVGYIADRVRKKEIGSQVFINVMEIPNEGLSKIRYVGAWAVAKVFHKKLKFVRVNAATKSKNTIKSVNQALECCRYVEEYIIAHISQLQESSKYLNTVALTESRQYRSRGLTHIDDNFYEFFLELEQSRVEHLNERKLKASKESVIDDALTAVTKNPSLEAKWYSCFSTGDELEIDKVKQIV